MCPQQGDTGAHTDNVFPVVRNIILPDSNLEIVDLRYLDTNNKIEWLIYSTGQLKLDTYLGGDGANVIDSGADALSDGQDFNIPVQGPNGEMYIDGVLQGSATQISKLTGTVWVWTNANNNMVADAAEFWPLYLNLPFTIPS